MAFKIIPPSTGIAQKPVPEKSGLLGGLGRNIARTATNIAGLPGDVLSTISNLGEAILPKDPNQKYTQGTFGDINKFIDKTLGLRNENLQSLKVPGSEDIGQFATEKLDLPENYLKPQGSVEEIYDSVIKNLPLTYLFGGAPFLQKLAIDIAGATTKKAAEKSGMGAVGQVLSGLIGGIGANKAINFFKKGGNPQSLINLAKDAETKYFKQATDLGEKINAPSKGLSTKLGKIGQQIESTTALKPAERTDLLEKLSKYETDSATGFVNAKTLMDRNQQLNAAWDQTQSASRQYKDYIKQIQKSLLDETKNIGSTHPQWYKDYNAAKNITKALNFGSEITRLVEEYPRIQKIITSPIIQNLLGIGSAGLAGGITGAALGAGAIAGAKKGTQIVGFLKQSPETRQLLGQVFKYTVYENIPRLIQSLNRLNKEAEKFENKNKKQLPSGKVGSFTIIPPS